LTERQLAELERVAAAASAGPWEGVIAGDDASGFCALGPVHTGAGADTRAEHDSDFICAAREALPALVAEVRRLRAEALDQDGQMGRLRVEAPC
jgi:hypothetical protein